MHLDLQLIHIIHIGNFYFKSKSVCTLSSLYLKNDVPESDWVLNCQMANEIYLKCNNKLMCSTFGFS